MSRAFVKDDAEDPGEPVKRQPSGKPNYVTPAGFESLKARAAGLTASAMYYDHAAFREAHPALAGLIHVSPFRDGDFFVR